MNLVRAEKLGLEMLEALGIEKEGVTAITLVCKTDDIARVIVKRIAYDKEKDGMKSVLERYNLVEEK